MVPMEPVQPESRVPNNLYLPAKVSAALALGIGLGGEAEVVLGMSEAAHNSFSVAGAAMVGAFVCGAAGKIGEYFIRQRE